MELKIGNSYSKSEIEGIFGTKFGFRVKGITLRKDKEGNPYILLFHSAKKPYPDQDLASEFEYIGEGLKGDQ